MSTEIRRDIQSKGEKSAFKQVGEATFVLNPTFTVLDQRREEREEEKRETELETETISRQYVGKAGEHFVQSELLFRGYNASIMPVDEGIDIIAIKEERQFDIQVKTSHEQNKKHNIRVTVSSFSRNDSGRTFYAFVLRGNDTHTLIFPYHVLQRYIDQGDITVDSSNKYKIEIRIEGNKYYLGKKMDDVSYYVDKWDSIK